MSAACVVPVDWHQKIKIHRTEKQLQQLYVRMLLSGQYQCAINDFAKWRFFFYVLMDLTRVLFWGLRIFR